ncbi:MAG: flagellar protein FlaG [Thermodesulfobacteriota bacterium]|nr:flagellar protein FlaG [Thermodesulfobacteriota bacterium]
MDVDFNAEVKGFGAPAVPVVVTADRDRPRVTPVQENSGTESGALGRKELHGNRSGSALEKETQLSAEKIAERVEEIQKRMNSMGSSLVFGLHMHEKAESIVIQLTDGKSGELVRQFPPEELLELQAKLDDLVGLLFDKKA